MDIEQIRAMIKEAGSWEDLVKALVEAKKAEMTKE